MLETTFRTAAGTAVLVDALAIGRNERGHQLGADAPAVLMRMIRTIEGEVEFDIEFAPRPEYGLVYPLLEPAAGGVTARGGSHIIALASSVALQIGDDSTAHATVSVSGYETFAMQLRSLSHERPELWTQAELLTRLDDTTEAWRTWSALHQAYEGPWRDLVHHSGRVLYALTYYPTGAICAAPTTSLPETPGGNRNWDYRYAWVRDTSFTLQALWVAACPDEANRFFDYISGAAASQVRRGSDLQIMFGIGGERDLTERELPHLRGWRNGAPVRVGNAAWQQRQLDVYGELLDAVARLPESIEKFGRPSTARFLIDLADAAAERWREPDQGIWEIRGEPRHFLYSKLMCWVAVDRAITLADRLDADDHVAGWTAARAEIAATILEHGWSETAGAFTQSFGSDDLDASNLVMAIVGFIDANDPRMRATIDATAERLTDEHGLVYRYRADDGLPGQEGTFVFCTFLLAQAQALTGDVERASATFERAVAFVNDVGLLAEEVDPESGELLGNFPQAFSHIGLVNAAWAITQAQGPRQ